MSFDNPSRHQAGRNAQSFAADATKIVRGPKGKRGRLADIIASVSTALVGTTAAPRVQVGVLGNLTQFADVVLGTTAGLAAGSVVRASDQPSAIKRDNQGIVLVPSDTDIYVTFKAGTGTPAGVADVDLPIDWF